MRDVFLKMSIEIPLQFFIESDKFEKEFGYNFEMFVTVLKYEISNQITEKLDKFKK